MFNCEKLKNVTFDIKGNSINTVVGLIDSGNFDADTVNLYSPAAIFTDVVSCFAGCILLVFNLEWGFRRDGSDAAWIMRLMYPLLAVAVVLSLLRCKLPVVAVAACADACIDIVCI